MLLLCTKRRKGEKDNERERKRSIKEMRESKRDKLSQRICSATLVQEIQPSRRKRPGYDLSFRVDST